MRSNTRSFYERAVLRTTERVLRGLDEALDLTALSAEVCLSPFHFHRIFRGMMGETPIAMHRRLRLERAAWALRQDKRSVTLIAFDAGYETHEAFTRAFRAAYGASPSEFRAMARADTNDCVCLTQPELAAPAGLLRPGAQMIGVYHDDPETVPESDLRSDAALTISHETSVPAGLTVLEISGGRYARAVHLGPYETLGDTWAQFMGGWFPESGERIGDGVWYEVYVNNPETAKPDELRTELYLPLA